MKNVKTKTLVEILDLNGEPNILEEMVDTNFKDYKIKMLKKNADPEAIVLSDFDDALVGTTSDGRLVYDIGLMSKILVETNYVDKIDADEYLHNDLFKELFDGLNPIYVNLNIDLVLQSLK
jgi:hypothetical protein